MDKTSKMSVREKTERARNFDRIFELLFGNVRLADESNRRHRPALERSSAQIKSGLDWMKIAQRVERSDRSNDKRAGHNRRQLVVSELHKRQRIQQIGAHAGDA